MIVFWSLWPLGAGSGEAQGWQSHLGSDPRDDEAPEAFTFCPECAEREFGES